MERVLKIKHPCRQFHDPKQTSAVKFVFFGKSEKFIFHKDDGCILGMDPEMDAAADHFVNKLGFKMTLLNPKVNTNEPEVKAKFSEKKKK